MFSVGIYVSLTRQQMANVVMPFIHRYMIIMGKDPTTKMTAIVAFLLKVPYILDFVRISLFRRRKNN